MKLRYLFISLLALVFATSCEEDAITQLKEVQVNSSYVALPADGGSKVITVSATDDWTITDVPEWLTVNPLSGGAGNTDVTFSAAKASDSQEATVSLTCAGKTQLINVLQLTEKTETPLSTCAEVIAGPESKTYRIKGVVTSIANTSYGNIYVNDGTGEVYIYGLFNAVGQYPKDAKDGWAGFNVEVGDEITVEGPKTVYGTTIELVDATLLKVDKSLIKVESVEPEEAVLPIEGGEFTVNLTCKGNGISVVLDDKTKTWLSVASVMTSGNAATVVFNAAKNEGGDRSTTLQFKTTDGKKDYTAQTSLTQKGSILEVPISEFLAAEVGDTQYRITGIITDLYASDKQGKSFYVQDYSGKTLVYRAEGFIEAGAKVGDVVTVVGKRGAYNDNPQLVSGTFEALKYAVAPITVAAFRELPDDVNAYYMLTGKVAQPTEENTKWDLEQYGNFNLTDETGSVYIYGVYTGWGGKKGEFGPLGIKEGDELTIVAYKTSYKGLVEGVGYYFSHKAAE